MPLCIAAEILKNSLDLEYAMLVGIIEITRDTIVMMLPEGRGCKPITQG